MATILRSRCTITVVGSGTTALITTYWDSTGAAIGALATESQARVRAMVNALVASIGTGSTYTPNLLVDEMDENTGAIVNQVVAAAPAALTFSAASPILPQQTQGLLQFQTATFIAGRRLRGRLYVPGLTTAAIATAGAVSAATFTILGNAAAALGTTVLTPMNQRVWHRPGRLTGTGGLSAVVTTRTASGNFAVMRSRRR